MTDELALHSPGVVRDLLQRHGLRADKSFGQNFLIDRTVLAALIAAAELDGSATVFEVGPGLGVLTRELAERAARVVAVELDRRLLPVLSETLAGHRNVEIKAGDALTFDLASLPTGSWLIANLPYNVATPVIARALESGRFRRLVLMVQKEVGDRLVAGPSSPAYGSFSLLVEHFGRSRIVRTVRPGSFLPAPEVTSAIVRIDVREGVQPDPTLFRLIRESFRHRRKTLVKNLEMAGWDRNDVVTALAAQGLDPRVRAEALALDEFRALRERLSAASQ